MGIQMISGFGGVSSYYKASEIPAVSQEEIRKQSGQIDTVNPETKTVSPDYLDESPQPVSDFRSRTADIKNISLTFNKEESFDYIGSESSLANLDVQKAISDMQKDQILQQYQYFVGSKI